MGGNAGTQVSKQTDRQRNGWVNRRVGEWEYRQTGGQTD